MSVYAVLSRFGKEDGKELRISGNRKLPIATGEFVNTILVCFSADVAPVSAMLCLCENGIFDTMGMLCRFLPKQYGSVCSRSFWQGYGIGCRGR